MAFKGSQDYKYYLYISASKLKMLYGQTLAATSKKKTFEWALNVKVASFKSSSTADKPDQEEMLRRVVEGLEANGQLGTLAEPKSFIRGSLPMRWGLYNDCHSRPEDEPALVYFGGFENDLLLGMGGSSCHVVGHEGSTSTWSRSSTPTLVRWILSALNKGKRPETLDDPQSEEDEVFRAMAVAQYYLRPPTQKLEFVAKTIAEGKVRGMEHFIGVERARVILATPLYVAHTDLLQIHRFRDNPVWGLTERDWMLKEPEQSRRRLALPGKDPQKSPLHSRRRKKQ